MQVKALKLNDLKKIARFDADNFMQTLPVTRSELFFRRLHFRLLEGRSHLH